MSNKPLNESPTPEGREEELHSRRLFLQGIGKWSGAAITASIAGTAILGTAPEAQAGAWINRRGGWMNRGGGWINRGGGGSWVNRGGGGWVNRRVGGGSWINRR